MKRKFILVENNNDCFNESDEIIIEQCNDFNVNLQNVKNAINQIIDCCVSLMGKNNVNSKFHLYEKFEKEGTVRDTNLCFYGFIFNESVLITTHTRKEVNDLIEGKIREKYHISDTYFFLEDFFLDKDWIKNTLYDKIVDSVTKEEKDDILNDFVNYLDDLRNFI